MKLNFRIYKSHLLMLCVAGVVLSGCKKALDIDPPTATITAQKAFSTDSLANSAMAGIYSELMTNSGGQNFANGASMLYGGLSSDELLNTPGSNNLIDYEFVTNTVNLENLTPDLYFWKPAYSIIYDCNLAISQLATTTSIQITPQTKVQITGECKFVRAFCYFYLTNFFGDVPMPLTTSYTTNAVLTRTSQAQVYQQIVQDLKDAQAALPADYSVSNNERIRANKWAATALLARVYLYQKDWQDAVTQSSLVISDNSLFSLVPTLTNVFLANSTEAILQLHQNPIDPPNNSTWDAQDVLPVFTWTGLTGSSGALYLAVPSLYKGIAAYVTPKYYFTPQLVAAFEKGDGRLASWTNNTPTPTASPYTGITYYYPYKYTTSIAINSAQPTQTYMILRLAEQYLIRAEAEAQLSNTSAAAADINVIRTRAGLANTTAVSQADLLTAVAHERQVELFCEMGHRFFDLKRTGNAASVLGLLPGKQPFNAQQLVYPIPANEITDDPRLVQNPGYIN